MLKLPIKTIQNAVKTGDIQQRAANRSYPSLSRQSVEQFGKTHAPRLSPAGRAAQRVTAEWVSITTAAELIGCDRGTVINYLRRGVLHKRPVVGQQPSLHRESVEEFAAVESRPRGASKARPASSRGLSGSRFKRRQWRDNCPAWLAARLFH